MLDMKSQIKEWIEQNPLRVWRKRNGLALHHVSSQLGVGLFTIQTWENGNSIPNSQNMAAIIEMTNNENISAEWKEWYLNAPSAMAHKGA